ncbi:MAG: DUF58 domain-containing protein, partial [Eubacteriales bacterium]|nr:DUF58 domain-containing protein [Eubacteriales bacterium]
QACEGDTIYIVETVENKMYLPVVWLRSEIVTSRWLDFAGPKSDVTHESRFVVSNFFLWGRQKVTRKWFVKCLKRGVFRIENVMLVWGDLFGLKEKALPVENADASIIVYPVPAAGAAAQKGISDRPIGNVFTRWMSEDPFINAGVREYNASDPMNRIHWKASAKAGRLMTLKNDFTTYPSFIILINVQSSEMDFGETTDKAEVEIIIKKAAAYVEKALKLNAGFAVVSNSFNSEMHLLNNKMKEITDIRSFAEHIDNQSRYRAAAAELTRAAPRGKGRHHAVYALNYLAGIELRMAAPYEYLLEAVAGGSAHDRSVIVSLSTYRNTAIEKLEKSLAASGRMVLS